MHLSRDTLSIRSISWELTVQLLLRHDQVEEASQQKSMHFMVVCLKVQNRAMHRDRKISGGLGGKGCVER
jgi:hypothetical protein